MVGSIPPFLTIVLLALGAGAVLVFAARRFDLMLLLLVASAPLETVFQISSNPLITLTKVTGVLAFGGFLIHAIITRRKLRFAWTHAVVVGILLVALVSTVQARDDSLGIVTTFRYGAFAALYLVVSQLVGEHRLLRRIVWALSLAAAAAGIFALQQYLTEASWAAVTPFGDPNDDAFTWITTLPLTLWLFTSSRKATRPVLVALVAIMLTATLYSLSRGALVGLGAGILWQILVERRHIRLLAGAAVAALVASIIVLNTDPDLLETSLRGKGKVATYNVESRLDAWTTAADLTLRNPLLGVGPGNFQLYYLSETGRPPGSKGVGVVHNAYLDVAAELGVLGLLLFLAYLVGSFFQLSGARRSGAGPPGLAAAVRTALVMAGVASMTVSEQYFQPFWLLGGIGAALWAESRERRSEPALTLP